MAHNTGNRYPSPLKSGDKIAMVSPAGKVEACHVENARAVLRQHGWDARISPNALGTSGTYSGNVYQRYGDLSQAFMDPDVRAIVCSRGGYGAVHLLEALDSLPIEDDPKWLVGFSDVSALHALMAKKGIVSLHGPMTKDISLGESNCDNSMLFRILEGERPEVSFPSSPYDRPGLASGQLLGGNLAVIADLIGTPFNVIKPDTILFIEDIGEPIYKIERILYQLRMMNVLPALRGLIAGQFTGASANENFSTVEEMIYSMVAPYSFPVAMNVPFGHVRHNIPLISGAMVTLRVTVGENNSIVYW